MSTEVTRISSKGQVVIPKELRGKLGLKEGDRLLVYVTGDLLVMRRVRGEESLLSIIAEPIRKKIEEKRITREDLERAVGEARKAGKA